MSTTWRPPRSMLQAMMREVDAMDPEWRRLINDYGPEAHMLYEDRVPIDATQGVLTVATARKQLERQYGRPI